MFEIKSYEVAEVKNPQAENFKQIKPESEISQMEAKSFWEAETEHYNSYQTRLDRTPQKDSVDGHWDGERGESKFIPDENTVRGKAAAEKLKESGLDGIEYNNAEPDFSPISEVTVKIENMTEYRYGEGGNFDQANIKCAEKWNNEAKDGCTDWTPRMVEEWRGKNNYTWHERCDTKSMDLVPREVHSVALHSGGVSECKVRDAIGNIGGGFDE